MAYTTIKKSDDYFNTKLYTGNGSTQSVTGVGFQPDFTWIKSRNDTNSHFLFDAVRGATKLINSNTTNAESTQADTLTSFDSDGFSLGDGTGVNGSSDTEASWNWLANGTGVANTDGSISSTVSANTTSGFSIVKYNGNSTAGATIGHGLGVAPSMIIIKAYSSQASGDNWVVYHKSMGNTKSIYLSLSNATDTGAGYFNNTSPTSSVFTVGNYDTVNRAVGDKAIIAYCFAEKQGFSKFGSYVGNGNADGTFVYTGFKPAFVMVKNSGTTDWWHMYDNKRDIDNLVHHKLWANESVVESADTNNSMDFLSNGFKMRDTNTGNNQSGGTYIYMAFAEQPLVGDNPATAR